MKSAPKFLFPSLRELLALCFCVCLILIGGVFSVTSKKTEASGTVPFSGFAWGASYLSGSSGNAGGQGWISFNCTNGTTWCSPSPYSVVLNSDNSISGYAWSSNYGWIKFGGLSGFPTGGGTTPANAQLSGNSITGWARACAGTVSGDCLGGTRSDFDGWIALSGSGYGLTLYGNGFTGSSYAWGGPDMGWISFAPTGGNPVRLGTIATLDLKVTTSSSINSDGPVSVDTGSTVGLSWTSQNVVSGTLCTTSSDDPYDNAWRSTSRPASSTSTVSYVVKSNINFFISCPDGRGGLAKDQVTVNLNPSADAPSALLLVQNEAGAYVSTTTLVVGDPIFLKWSSNSSTVRCTSPTFPTGNSTSNPGTQFGTASASNSYTISCFNSNGDRANSGVTVNVSNSLNGCADPAGGEDFAEGEVRNYFKSPQGRSCVSHSRTCTAGSLDSSYSDYIYASCTPDPNYKEQ